MLNKRLLQARKAAGLSLRELGDSVSLSHAAIKKYEDGIAKPSSDVLLKIARILGVRTEYFFRPHLISDLQKIKFRKHPGLPQKKLDVITFKVIEMIERRHELENLFPKAAIPYLGIKNIPLTVHSFDQIELIAENVRKTWKLGIGPIPDLLNTLEMQGIRVFISNSDTSLPTDPSLFDGLHSIVNDTPIIVISGQIPGDRQRFTLAHELGHLILEGKLAKEIDEELACNRFAAALLFPKESFIHLLGKSRSSIELRELDFLKHEYGISMLSILYRAEELGIINKNIFNTWNRQFKNNGWIIQEPGRQYPQEILRLFNQFVFYALAEDCIGESKAAELLSLSLTDFRRMRAMEGEPIDILL